MEAALEEKFLKFVEIAIASSITDIHINTGSCPYIRSPSRDIVPIEQFGILTYDEFISLVIYMNPLLTREKIEQLGTGISFIFEHSGTRFRANVSKNNE